MNYNIAIIDTYRWMVSLLLEYISHLNTFIFPQYINYDITIRDSYPQMVPLLIGYIDYNIITINDAYQWRIYYLNMSLNNIKNRNTDLTVPSLTEGLLSYNNDIGCLFTAISWTTWLAFFFIDLLMISLNTVLLNKIKLLLFYLSSWKIIILRNYLCIYIYIYIYKCIFVTSSYLI